MGIFDNAGIVVVNNKQVQSIVTEDGGVLYYKLMNTQLSIDVPLNLVYSDAFNITGALTDGNNNGVSGATVSLKVGSSVVDSTTTNSNGAYSFTQTPVSTGNHSFQVVYDGDSQYEGSESSVVSRVVGKETSVLSVTNPVSGSTVYVDGSLNITGVLTDDDGESLVNKSIVISENGTTLTTLTTGSNGGFTGSLNNLSLGSHTLTFEFTGDGNYTSSTVTRTIMVINHNYALSLSLIGDRVVEAGDSVDVIATLTDNGVTVEYELLSYAVKCDGAVIEYDSRVTDENGELSTVYFATGMGDVEVTVSYGDLEETVMIEDCLYVSSMTSDDENWDWNSNMGHTYSNDGVTFYRSTGEGNICSKSLITLPSDFEVEYTYMGGTLYSIEVNIGGAGATHDIRNNRTWYYYRECGNQDSSTLITVNETVSSGDVFKVRRENGVLSIYRNDVLKHSFTSPNSNYNYMELVGYINSRNSTIKDIKVKAL